MAHSYGVTLRVPESGETVSLSGQLSDEDWELFENFVVYSEELLDTKWIRDGMQAKLEMQWTAEAGMTFATELPHQLSLALDRVKQNSISGFSITRRCP